MWKEIKMSNGDSTFISGFVPLTEYSGGGFKDLSKDGFVMGESTGVYVMSEIAPNVCRVTRVQNVELQGSKFLIPETVINYLIENQLSEANHLQEKYRRNGREVDAEIREVVVKRMKEGCEVTEDQRVVFEDLERLFGGEETLGWRPLKSPFEVVKMEIKYKQQEKGVMSVALGRAEGKWRGGKSGMLSKWMGGGWEGRAGAELTRFSVLLVSPQVLQIAQQKRQLLGTLISAAGKDALKTKRTET